MNLTEVEASAATEASGTTSKSFASKAKSTESKEWANELVRDGDRKATPHPAAPGLMRRLSFGCSLMTSGSFTMMASAQLMR
jgi:hypothetical protein